MHLDDLTKPDAFPVVFASKFMLAKRLDVNILLQYGMDHQNIPLIGAEDARRGVSRSTAWMGGIHPAIIKQQLTV